MFRPLAFDYPQDQTACRVEDQVMLGGECMIAPIYEQNACGRHVYLPEDMLFVRFRKANDYDCTPMQAGHHFIELELNEMPLFIKKNCMIPLSAGGEWVDQIDAKRLTMLGWIAGDAFYDFYDDDGVCAQVEMETGLKRIAVRYSGDGVQISGDGLELVDAELIAD